MRRALPSIAAALLITALLAAAVIAAPERPPADQRSQGAGPLVVMRERPTESLPKLQRFQVPEPEPAAQQQPVTPAPPLEPIAGLAPDPASPRSRALGQPWSGRLRHGVQLPPSGVGYYTFDSALRRSPSMGWRRFGTDVNVTRTRQVLADFRAAHPDGPRIGVGDLSRPRGGPFGREFGGVGHASHQNGRDVDVYYPRRDGREVPPAKASEVERRLSQELVDSFVAAGAEMVFVGPSVGLRGPRGVVQKLAHHDDHLHARWPGG